MKTWIKILPLIVLFASCGKPKGNKEQLEAKRDSLQDVLHKTTLEINQLNLQIGMLDTSLHKDDKAILKKIITQKTRIANIEKKIRTLQNDMSTKKEGVNNIPVAVKEMEPEAFNHYFTVFGSVEADKYGKISPEMGGKVEAIHVEEGQSVKKGDLLVTLNSDAIQQQISGIKSNLEFATQNYDKQKALWDQKIGSEIQFLQAKTAKEGLEAQLDALKAQLQMTELRAPYDGIVNKIYPKKGEMAGPQMPVIEFVNLSKITVRAQISENYVSSVKKGQHVEVTFAALPNVKLDLPINRVSDVINPKSRTFEIELNFDNKNNEVKPNMVSTIRVNDFSADSAFVIPSLVIKRDITGDYVYLASQKDGKTVVAKRAVKIGLSYRDESMINSGLKTGDKVIVKGYNLVSTGIPVSIK